MKTGGGRGGPAGAGYRLGATAGQQRQQQQPEEEEWFFFPLALFFFFFFSFPGCCFLQHLQKERIVPTRVCFKRCFFSAARLEEDEGQCMPCTWFSLKIVVLSNMDCDSFRGKEKHSGKHCENFFKFFFKRGKNYSGGFMECI